MRFPFMFVPLCMCKDAGLVDPYENNAAGGCCSPVEELRTGLVDRDRERAHSSWPL